MSRQLLTTALAGLLLASCGNATPPQAVAAPAPVASPSPATAPGDSAATTEYSSFVATDMGRFNEPWAMTFLPDGRLLVTEKQGVLKLHALDGATLEIGGVPTVAYGGQGGLGDVVAHPKFADNGLIYLSYVEAGEGDTFGAVVVRAKLVTHDTGGTLENVERIWEQTPKMSGRGHFGHRIAFAPNGDLYISSGERQHFDPAQDMSGNLGKIVRLNDDGSVPTDNPFAEQGGVAAQVWSLGHRNPLGLAFDPAGQLWNIEMGPKGGDELNRVVRGANYGYPIVSNGDHYDGRDIPDHDTRPEFSAPAISWTPVISPGDVIFYTGNQFPAWNGNALAAGLSSKSLVRIQIDGESAREVERFDMGQRIREVEQGPDGAIYLLEDGANARLLKLTPKV
ncbi:MAG: PQQ-dependent sugar dehydrogenase [Rhodanobacteraceae bacterium]|nr:PQQ-dependent sugar dehydrogenase [Rhodanobacteraceae bacterium]